MADAVQPECSLAAIRSLHLRVVAHVIFATEQRERAQDGRALRMENKPPGDEGWGGGEIVARYERGVMLFLLILTVTLLALGAYLIGV